MTNSSSGIQHAWHFWYALVLCCSAMRKLGYCVLHPLTGR
ncbi:DUF3265 domain-containing protein [Vibrio alginolyticus]|nr:DUF3265 domain-containing protein [Vibrio alginolyticus]